MQPAEKIVDALGLDETIQTTTFPPLLKACAGEQGPWNPPHSRPERRIHSSSSIVSTPSSRALLSFEPAPQQGASISASRRSTGRRDYAASDDDGLTVRESPAGAGFWSAR